jgi:hypothetical protein
VKWLTDITELQIPAGKVYVSPMIDCFDGLVVSRTIGTRPDSDLVNTLLDAAIETVSRAPPSLSFIRTEVLTIAGQGGCNGCIAPSSSDRCHAKGVRLTMLPEKDSLAD